MATATPTAPRPAPQPGDVQLRSYFATPIAVVELPNAPALNEALAATILAREATQPSVQHSNLGGWQSSWDFASWGGAAGDTVLRSAAALANRLTADRQGRPVTIEWRMNAWANVNRSGHGNEFHTHPGSYWSGTYYVDDGGAGDDSALGGEFEIQDPRGVAPAMYAPLLCFATPGGRSVGASELIRPRAGVMVLFPAWLSHGVRPYRGAGIRISVAFNLSV
jgi:uncharacterized protein (TIGR02466 family)